MGSVLRMEAGWLGVARNSVQQYALETRSEQGSGIAETVDHDCVVRPAFDTAGRPREAWSGGQGKIQSLACIFPILHGIIMQELRYCQGLELS